MGLDAAEYPRLPAVEDASPLKIPQKLLKEKINQVIFATADDETRPILTGVLMEMGQDMTLVALDGYRLAMNHLPLSMDGNRRSVVPGKSLSEMARTLSDGDELVEISFQGNHIRLDMGPIQMISRLLEGQFIQYRQILPTDFSTLVKLSREEFFDAIQRASLVVREGRNNLNPSISRGRSFPSPPTARWVMLWRRWLLNAKVSLWTSRSMPNTFPMC